MRRLYNEGSIKHLAKKGHFNIKIKPYKPSRVTKRIPAGSKSFGTYYYDKISNELIARFHHYEHPNGKIIGLFDPKFLRIGGIEYHLPEQGLQEPGRIGNKEINRILAKTGVRAKITYLYHCSEQAQKLWKEKITTRLVKLGLREGRD